MLIGVIVDDFTCARGSAMGTAPVSTLPVIFRTTLLPNFTRCLENER